MATLVKQFSFNSDAENFTFITTGSPTGMTGTRDTSDDSTNDTNAGNGNLQTSRSGKNLTNGVGNWVWAGTWEDLGVPPGATVTDVNLDYDWKCSTYTTGDPTSVTGSANLRNSAAPGSIGTNRATFSPTLAFGATSAWATRTGTPATGLSDASDTAIQLTLSAIPKTGNSNSAVVTVRQDWIVVTVDYTAGGGSPSIPELVMAPHRPA